MKKIVLLVLTSFFAISAGYIFMFSDYNPIFKNKEFVDLNQSLEVAKKENLSSIINLYNEIHKTDKPKFCPCDIITRSVDPFRHKISPKRKIYSAKIKEDFTSNDCLKQYLLSGEYLHEIIGIQNAAEYYFKKTLQELNEKEKITLLVMLENPTFYNPQRRQKIIDKKITDYQKLLNN